MMIVKQNKHKIGGLTRERNRTTKKNDYRCDNMNSRLMKFIITYLIDFRLR